MQVGDHILLVGDSFGQGHDIRSAVRAALERPLPIRRRLTQTGD